MLRTFAILATLLGIAAVLMFLRRSMKPEFPWKELELESASLSSTVRFNPYSDYPPGHRWEIGLSFREFTLTPGKRSYAPIITYTVNLKHKGWSELPGTYDLSNEQGSDFWHGDDNHGPVMLDKIEIKQGKANRFHVALHLHFEFEDSNYRPTRKVVTFPVEYSGLNFFVPSWNEPDKVSFPSAWGIPSSKPHWKDEEIKAFLGKHVDLSQYQELNIDQSGSCSKVTAKPK